MRVSTPHIVLSQRIQSVFFGETEQSFGGFLGPNKLHKPLQILVLHCWNLMYYWISKISINSGIITESITPTAEIDDVRSTVQCHL